MVTNDDNSEYLTLYRRAVVKLPDWKVPLPPSQGDNDTTPTQVNSVSRHHFRSMNLPPLPFLVY